MNVVKITFSLGIKQFLKNFEETVLYGRSFILHGLVYKFKGEEKWEARVISLSI